MILLDADERVTPHWPPDPATMAGAPAHGAFQVPHQRGIGRWIRSTDWYPDYQVRLYDRRAAQWTGQYVHEALTTKGSVGRLHGELQHFAYRDIADHLETIDRYTTLAARQMRDQGRHAGFLQLAGHPPLAFLRNYIARGGIRDGVPGLVVSTLNAYYVFLKFAKLRELRQSPGEELNRRMLAAYRHGATWRGGQNQVLLTVNGLRETASGRRS